MRFKQSVTAAFAAVAGIAISAGVPASAAQAATTTVTLPIAKYSHMLLDPVHQHLFFTSGSGSTSILVTDYSGQTVATIGNEPGATGLALSSDGSTVYAALADGDAVSAISTSTLAETVAIPSGPPRSRITSPTAVARSGSATTAPRLAGSARSTPVPARPPSRWSPRGSAGMPLPC